MNKIEKYLKKMAVCTDTFKKPSGEPGTKQRRQYISNEKKHLQRMARHYRKMTKEGSNRILGFPSDFSLDL